MKRALLFISLLIPVVTLFGQGKICGKITDARNGSPVSDVVIFSSDKKVYSNNEGHFCLLVPEEGLQTVHFLYTGYKNTDTEVEIKDEDSLYIEIRMEPVAIDLEQTVVTASRYRQRVLDIPGRMNLAGQDMVIALPVNNADKLLSYMPNIYINRSRGIFTKSAGITMRGLSGTSRTLVLLDGLPLNKSTGGSINWDLVDPENIEKIEVYKGPGSALYGNNAMAGVINILTTSPTKKLEGMIKVGAGTYHTRYVRADLGSLQQLKNGGSLSMSASGNFRISDGYIPEPEATRNQYDVNAYLQEVNAGGKLSYTGPGKGENVLSYRYRDGKYGTGIKVYEDDGAFDRYRTHFLMAHHGSSIGSFHVNASAFLQIEQYDRQNENINSTATYKLYNTYSTSYDAGLWLNAGRTILGSHTLLFGADVKAGKLDAEDIYRTSTDDLTYGGNMMFGGVFAQDEFHMLSGRLAVQMALRFDLARFHGGFLTIQDPTSATGFIQSENMDYSDNTWHEFSPKINLGWLFSGQLNTYLSYSKGFMPPKLDDLCRSGKISKGFKLANPDLTPETVGTLEWGWNIYPMEGLEIQPSLYWSEGRDFQYFVATGDSLETGDGQLRPVLQRQNVSQVTILGAEIAVKYAPRRDLNLFLNYAYNHGYINHYNSPEGKNDLSGKLLIESPENLASGGLNWNNRVLPFSISCTYTGSQWYDDENITLIDGFFLLDIKMYKEFLKHYTASLSIENLLDNRYVDRKGLEAPGRFIMVELTAKI